MLGTYSDQILHSGRSLTKSCKIFLYVLFFYKDVDGLSIVNRALNNICTLPFGVFERDEVLFLR